MVFTGENALSAQKCRLIAQMMLYFLLSLTLRISMESYRWLEIGFKTYDSLVPVMIIGGHVPFGSDCTR